VNTFLTTLCAVNATLARCIAEMLTDTCRDRFLMGKVLWPFSVECVDECAGRSTTQRAHAANRSTWAPAEEIGL
jgi:hypothetical protein